MDKPEVHLQVVAYQPITAQERGESWVQTNNDMGGVVQNVWVSDAFVPLRIQWPACKILHGDVKSNSILFPAAIPEILLM